MVLTREEYEAMVKGLSVQKNDRPEHRRAPRVPHRTLAQLTPIVGGQPGTPIDVVVRDFSPRGVGLVTQRKPEAGSQFALRLPRMNEAPVTLLCTCCHIRVTGHGAFHVGAEFVCLYADPKQATAAMVKNAPSSDENVAEAQRLQKSILD